MKVIKDRYIESYHGLRGLAASMIFFSHAIGGYYSHSFHNLTPFIHKVLNIGVFGVELFFILSGYVIYKSVVTCDYKVFFKKRFFRIYPVFIFFTLLYFILNKFFIFDLDRIHIEYLIYNVLFLNLFTKTPALTPNAWSLTYEVIFYFMAFLTLSGVGRFILIRKILGLILTAYMLITYPITIYFLIGIYLYIFTNRYQIKKLLKENISITLLNYISIFLITILIYLLTKDRDYNSWDEILKTHHIIYIAILSSIFLVLLQVENILLNKLLIKKFMMYLGTVSYSLYLCHPYSYKLSFILSRFIFENHVSSFLTYMLLNICITLLFVHFIYKNIEYRFLKK